MLHFLLLSLADNFKLPAEIRLLVRRVVQAVVVHSDVGLK